eukprot:3314174-Amphidinium_carterae.1
MRKLPPCSQGYGEGDEDDLMLGRSAGRQRDIKDAPEPPCDLPAGREIHSFLSTVRTKMITA